MEQVDVYINGAEVRIEVNGVQGPQCKDITQSLENALGTTMKVEQKADYHRMPTTSHQQKATQ